jgi:2-oxoglutarate dehydrogenase E2 component (dihydrolipoamide succinyltransferase)
MSAKITVPELGESVVEATVARWLKKEGDRVNVGEPLVELETEKVDLEVGATEAGVLASIEADEGTDVQIGAVLAVIEAAGSEEAGSAEAGGDAHERDAR